MTPFREAAANLARALERMPSYCNYSWTKGNAHIVKRCGRCVALDDYRAVAGAEEGEHARPD